MTGCHHHHGSNADHTHVTTYIHNIDQTYVGYGEDSKKTPPGWLHKLSAAFFSTFSWLVTALGPFIHGGITFLAVQEFLLHMIAMGYIAVSFQPWIFPIAFSFSIFCGLENWGLEVQAANDELKHLGNSANEQISDFQQKWSESKSWLAAFALLLPKWRRLIPDFFIRLYYQIKGGFPESDNPYEQAYYHDLKNKPYILLLLQPILKIFGPIASGAESFMGLIPTLFFISTPMLMFAGSEYGSLTFLGYTVCALAFAVSATQTRSLDVNNALRKLRSGLRGSWQGVKALFSPKAEYAFGAGEIKSLDANIEYHFKLVDINASLNPAKQTALVHDENLKPLITSDFKHIIIVNEAGQSINHPNHIFISNPHLQGIDKFGLRHHHTGEHINDIDGYHVAINLVQDNAGIENQRSRRDKGFYERLVPKLGIMIAVVGPLLAAGAALLGFATTTGFEVKHVHHAISALASQPWLFALGLTTAITMGILCMYLDVNRAVKMLQDIGRDWDNTQAEASKYKSRWDRFRISYPWQAYVPDMLIGLVFFFKKPVRQQIEAGSVTKQFCVIETTVYKESNTSKRYEHRSYQVVAATELDALKDNEKIVYQTDNKLDAHSAKRTLTVLDRPLVQKLCAPFLKVIGPLAHGVEGFRNSRPIFFSLMLIFMSNPTSIHGSIALLVFAALGFVAAAIQNQALEVTETVNQLYIRGKLWQGKCRPIDHHHEIGSAHPRSGSHNDLAEKAKTPADEDAASAVLFSGGPAKKTKLHAEQPSCFSSVFSCLSGKRKVAV